MIFEDKIDFFLDKDYEIIIKKLICFLDKIIILFGNIFFLNRIIFFKIYYFLKYNYDILYK